MAYTTAQLLGALLTVDGRATEGGIIELPPNARILLDVLVEGSEDGDLLEEIATAVLEAKAARDEAVDISNIDTTDAAIKTTLELPGSESGTYLAATYATRGAPDVLAPLLATTPIALTTEAHRVYSYNPASGLFYGMVVANGHYATSPDLVTWTDRTYSPSTYTPNAIGYEFDATYQYAYNGTGQVWRAPLLDFDSWTEISVPTRGPLTTGRPGSLCALGSGVLLYGNYTSAAGDGVHIWRSTDAGATWTEVLSVPAGKHVHAIRLSPNTGYVWASVGDQGFTGTGLWKSEDDGATWTQVSSNDYGIDMVFAPAQGRLPDRIILEGDGLNRPLLMGFDEDAAPGTDTYPLVWFTGAPADPNSTRGTARGIGKTPQGDVIFFITTESGAVGSRAGIYVAQGPDYTRAVLLREMTGVEPVAYMASMCTATKVMNFQTSFATPTFGSY